MNYLASLIRLRQRGDDPESAVEAALSFFKCSRAEVEVRILSPGRQGVLGFGRRDAEVEVALVDRAYIARHLCDLLLQKTGWLTEVTVSQSSNQIELQIESDSSAQIIGKHGQTLDALQFLVNSMTDRLCPGESLLLLDTGGYRQKRHSYLRSLASKLSAKVRSSGNRVTVEPLPHHERRLLHSFFNDQRGVSSASIGRGLEKRIVVTPEG
ncbi:MAG: hypothetical protein C0624_13790 [Desulfuromonas sp.]|nr:MAG: hypothetical protein C0624_13790 [Desulfuromonas sp.]